MTGGTVIPSPSQFRCSVAGSDLLQTLATAPLPLGLREQSAATGFHRDLYFDTAVGDARGVQQVLQADGVRRQLGTLSAREAR